MTCRPRHLAAQGLDRLTVVLVLVVVLAGCGYRVVSSRAPAGVSHLALEPFAENEPVGVSAPLSTELARLLVSGGVSLGPLEAASTAKLTGRVTSAKTRVRGVANVRSPVPAYEVSINVEARLVSAQGNELWRGAVSVTDDFLPTGAYEPGDMLATEAARTRALGRIAERAARELYERLLMAPGPSGGA